MLWTELQVKRLLRPAGQWLLILLLGLGSVRPIRAQSANDAGFLAMLGELREASFVDKETIVERLTGTGSVSDDPATTMTRPLCPYPQIARYNGSGDGNQATSFTCAEPRQ